MLGIKPSTFYRWYDRYRSSGPEALEDKPSKPDRVWNRIPADVRQRVVMMAFERPELSPRELATRFTDTNSTQVSFFGRLLAGGKLGTCASMRAVCASALVTASISGLRHLPRLSEMTLTEADAVFVRCT